MKALILALALLPATLSDAPVPAVPRTAPKAVYSDDQCAASAIYHEARGEPLEGQRAVYEVIRNRAKAMRKTVCAVVKAPGQFSWVGEKPILPFGKQMRELLDRVVRYPTILNSEFKWFHAISVTPRHESNMECRVIGNHKFCKPKEKKDEVQLRSDHPGIPSGERREAGVDEMGLPQHEGHQ